MALRVRALRRPLLHRRGHAPDRPVRRRPLDDDAIALSVAGIGLAWIVYDVLCRTLGTRSQTALAVVGTGLVALAAWVSGELFAPRAAYLQVGVMLGTIMAANVFLVIIPAHRKLVTAMEEKREPDAAPLLEAKNRSVHNNYLTLPVLFTMLAGHFAFVFGADEAWLVFVLIAVLTALIRVFFNRWHAGQRVWWIPAVAAVADRRTRAVAPARGDVPFNLAATRVRPGAGGDDCTLRPVPLGRVGAARDPLRDTRGDRGAHRRHRTAGRSDEDDASRQRDGHHGAGTTAPRSLGREHALGSADARDHGRRLLVHGSLRGGGRARDRRAFRGMLPLDSKIIHVRWSGEGGWIPMGDLDLGLGPENATRYPSPGELIFYPGGVSETELLLAYGYVAFASKAGALAGNHFATIVSGQREPP